MKVVVNRCYGGFSLSNAAAEWLMENRGYTLGDGKNSDDWKKFNIVTWDGLNMYVITRTLDGVGSYDIEFRCHPDIIAVVETIGEKEASGSYASLVIVEIPDDIEWEIEEYDGNEWVSEKHRTW